MKLLIPILDGTLRLAGPLIFAAMAGILAERSGVVNIALEGMMLIGAFVGIPVAFVWGTAAGIIAAILAGVLLGLLHAAATQTLRIGAIVSGVAINILAAGLTSYLARTPKLADAFGASVGPQDWSFTFPAGLPGIGGQSMHQNGFTVAAFLAVALVAFFLWRTPWGMRVTAAGENPEAVKAAGINVTLLRYGTLAASGALAAAGGVQLSLGGIHTFTENMTAGRGFIALAAVVFGRWRPGGAFAACLFFAFAGELQDGLQLVPAVAGKIPTELMAMLPYLATLLALVFFSKQVRPPAALSEAGAQ